MEHGYCCEISPVTRLTDEIVHVMADLYLTNFDGSSEALFRADLTDKDEVILLFHEGELAGFTALKIFGVSWQGCPVRVVYSGDTIVAPAHWGQQALAFAWIARVGEIKAEAPTVPLYWFLLVKGHRTFKYLYVFGNSFHPHWAQPREDLKALADHLSAERFGQDYDRASGVVRFPVSRGHLKAAIADASAQEMTKPSTRFFFSRNPGYREGHELVCLCELEASNMRPLAARIFRRTLERARP
jgi:hypothetical protein